MTFRGLILYLVILGLISLADSMSKEDPFSYHIESEQEALIGHISHDAEKGAKVIAEIDSNGHKVENAETYLKVLITKSVETTHPLKHTSRDFDITMVTSPDRKITHDNTNAASSTFNHVQTHTARMTGSDVQSSHLAATMQPTTTKPPKFVVKETNAFLVDPFDHYIRVNDTAHIREYSFIQFYVVLEDEDGVAVSNPLPFLVHVNQSEYQDPLRQDSRGKEDPYDYHIEAEHESLVGHISHDTEKGAKVIAEIEEVKGHGHEAENAETLYLKVLMTQSVKTVHPLKHTSRDFGITMVTSPDRKITHDNTNAASNTFNHVQTHAARMTGSDVQSSHIPGVHSLPTQTQKFTSETRVITANEKPISSADTSAPVTTNTQTKGPTQGTWSNRVHVTTANANTHPKANNFRNIIPHGHNIHLTHLLHDPTHPVVNKRSVETKEKVDTLRKNRMLRHRNKRHFAVPPEHFQPRAANVQSTTTKPPKFVVKETHAFLVDPIDHYIRVNDTAHIGEHTLIQFYVVLEDEDGLAVSNPLPFIVYVDQPEESDSYPAVPAVFAGVLVLCVIFLAVLIPLVTRAKRRYKQGKPMFKLGSHPSRADLEKVELENQSNMTRNASEPNWYGNNIYYNYEDEVAKERSDFTKGLRQYSTKSEPPTLQLHKKKKAPLSDSSSSSGIDSASQGANGYDGEDTYSQRM